jgi:hypothetical protein
MQVSRSARKDKKFVATFPNHAPVHFGQRGASDYTIHKDKERRARYIKRHKVNENWTDPYSAGALSRYILWGPTTSLTTNIRLYKERFNV